MKNRLRIFLRVMLLWPVLSLTVLTITRLQAQNSAFNFFYPGPDTIGTGGNCPGRLAGAVGMPVVGSTVGAAITMSMFDSIASGFGLYTHFQSVTTKTVHWLVKDDAGNVGNFTFPVTFYNPVPEVLKEASDSIVYCMPNNNHLIELSKWIQHRGYSIVTDAGCSRSGLTYRMTINGNTVDSAQVIAQFLSNFSASCQTRLVGADFVNQVSSLVEVSFFATDSIISNYVFAGSAFFVAVDTMRPHISGPESVEPCGGANDSLALVSWINTHGNNAGTDCSAINWNNFTWKTSEGVMGTGNFNTGPYPVINKNSCEWWVDVTFFATDECGNAGSGTLRFRIADNTPPVISGFQAVTNVYCPNDPPDPNSLTATAADNCDPAPAVSKTSEIINGLCSGNYTVRVIWTATDRCGNSSTALQTFVVRDTIVPFFTQVPAPKTFRCDTFVLPPAPVKDINIFADDVCSVITGITTQDFSTQNIDPGLCGHYNYTVTRVFTATDDCGNTKTATQLLTIVDNLPPVITGTASLSGVCDVAPIIPTPSAFDACSGITGVSVESRDTFPGACDNSYTVQILWRARDVCANFQNFTQNIFIQDTVRPTLSNVPANITVEYDNIPPVPPNVFLTAADNCDNTPTISAPIEDEFRNPDPSNCSHWNNYTIRRRWTVTDNCGNARTYTQLITVRDSTAPHLVLQPDHAMATDPGVCGANVLPPAPLSLYDRGTAVLTTITLRDTAYITDPLSQIEPILPLSLQLNPALLPPGKPAIGAPVLTISLDNMDADQTTETLAIWVEDTINLGNTSNTSNRCNSSSSKNISVDVNELNKWLADGVLKIKLIANGSGSAAVNPSCTNQSRARVTLTYQVADQQVPVGLSYRIDGGPSVLYALASPAFLSTGAHSIVYTATDCAGNTATAALHLTVEDRQAPEITAPSNQTVYTAVNNCEATTALPFPGLFENCAFPELSVPRFSPEIPVKFENDPDIGHPVPQNLTINVAGVTPRAAGNGILKIRHRGHNAHTGEFFRIFDENNTPLGTTAKGPLSGGECNAFFITEIPVTAAQINSWGANNAASFRLEANRDIILFDTFIKPCAPLNAANEDGTSAVQVILEYNTAVVGYQIRTTANTVVKSGVLSGNATPATLRPGQYTVQYNASDAAGRIGTATYNITIRDTVRPVARCVVSYKIETNPSGLVSDTLHAAQIDAGSTDNCSGNLSFQFSQNVFDCRQVSPNPYAVTMTVFDSSGNSATCNTLIRVVTQPIKPTYTPVCEGGRLELFSNAPPAPSNIYTFQWTGPNNFSSSSQNPVIQPAQNINEGTYRVTVTGNFGCTAVGDTLVDLLDLPNKPALVSSQPSYCVGQSIVLSTTSYAGQNVFYQWFGGNPLNAVPIDTTLLPTLTISHPTVGAYSYFLRIAGNGCKSQDSEVINLTVSQVLTAQVKDKTKTICGGEPLTLEAVNQGTGIQYNWTGPAGFSNTLRTPKVADKAQPIHQGVYHLIVSQSGCSSLPDSTIVTIRPQPAKPVISGDKELCEGENVVLVYNNPQAGLDSFIWVGPNNIPRKTALNSLTLQNMKVPDAGNWRLNVWNDGCKSETSDLHPIAVQKYPVVYADANDKTLCKGSSLNLRGIVDGSDTGLKWQWTGPGLFDSPKQNPDLTQPLSGTYKVTATSSFGCSDSDSVTVEIIVPPKIETVTSVAPVCATGTQNDTLRAVIELPHGPLQYEWNGPAPFGASTMPIAIIPGITAANNGTYTLVVEDTFKCKSAPFPIVINVRNIPATPELEQVQAVCAGSSVMLRVGNASQYPSNATYRWQTPTGAVVGTLAPSFEIDPVSTLDSGHYRVSALVDQCESAPSAIRSLTVNPIPPAPVISANSPVCAGDTLSLSVPSLPGAGYFWSGPGGFNAGRPDPSRLEMDSTKQGPYRAQIILNGCASPFGTVNVVVRSSPKAPSILPPAPVCPEQNGALLDLKIAPNTATPGASFQWFNALTSDSLGSASESLTYQTINLGGFKPGENKFYTVARLNGCFSKPSQTVSVQFDTIPDVLAYAGNDFSACDQKPLRLQATKPGGNVGGRWNLFSGPLPNILTPNLDTTSVTGIFAGNTYEFTWVLSNGACKNFATDTIKIKVDAFEKAVARPILEACALKNDTLSATQGAKNAGYWTQSANQQTVLRVKIDDPTKTNTRVDSLVPGNIYYFFWNIDNPGCGTSTDTLELRNYSRVGNQDAGANRKSCNSDACEQLMAKPLQLFETGKWSSDNAALRFQDDRSPNTSVCNLASGPNRIFWTTNERVCNAGNRDTLVIDYEITPTLREDIVEIQSGKKDTFDVRLNDIIPATPSINVITPPRKGVFVELEPGVYSYQPSPGVTEDEMEYQVCNLNCENNCNTTKVRFTVSRPDSCLIPSVFTPNNDGVNDVFFITPECLIGIEGSADGHLAIYNQWGDQVFEANPYQNDWSGEYKGEELPAGTYYYILKNTSTGNVRNGFVLIQR